MVFRLKENVLFNALFAVVYHKFIFSCAKWREVVHTAKQWAGGFDAFGVQDAAVYVANSNFQRLSFWVFTNQLHRRLAAWRVCSAQVCIEVLAFQ